MLTRLTCAAVGAVTIAVLAALPANAEVNLQPDPDREPQVEVGAPGSGRVSVATDFVTEPVADRVDSEGPVSSTTGGSVSGGGAASGGAGSGDAEGSVPRVPFDPVYGYHGDGWVFVDEHHGEVIPECVVDVMYVCPSPLDLAEVAAAAPAASEADPAPTFAETEAMVTRVLVQLEVPKPSIRLGPDPAVNEWNIAVVGHPLWLWTDEPATRSATVSAYGYDFDLSARRDSVTFDPGDGSAAITCASATPYPGGAAVVGQRSPDCGHVYTRPSLPAGSYVVRATARWTVSWSALGYSGTLPMPLTSMRRVPVGELQSIRQS